MSNNEIDAEGAKPSADAVRVNDSVSTENGSSDGVRGHLLLYGTEFLRKKYGLTARPRLVCTNPDLDNLDSKKMGNTCYWMDLPPHLCTMTTLNSAVVRALNTASESACAVRNLCVNAEGVEQFAGTLRQKRGGPGFAAYAI